MLANTQSDEAYTFTRQHIENNPLKAVISIGLFGRLQPIFTPWDNGWYVGAQRKGSFMWLNGKLQLKLL